MSDLKSIPPASVPQTKAAGNQTNHQISCAADALWAFVTSPSGLQLDEVTRKYLLVAWACEQAAYLWKNKADVSECDIAEALQNFKMLCAQAKLLYCPGLEPILCGDLPWNMQQLCCFISDFVGTPEESIPPLQYTGLFVSVEGGDGSGKSTQTKDLAAALQQRHDLSAVATRALGGAPGSAQELRALILQPAYKWHSVSEALLTIAIYREGLRQVIVPALAAGYVVVSDRWIDTLSVYLSDPDQGITPHVYKQLYDILVRDIAPGLLPDITFLLDIDFETAMQRRASRPAGVDGAPAGGQLDRNEGKGELFHRGVLLRYREHAVSGDARFVVIDAKEAASTVLNVMLDVVLQRSKAQSNNWHEVNIDA